MDNSFFRKSLLLLLVLSCPPHPVTADVLICDIKYEKLSSENNMSPQLNLSLNNHPPTCYQIGMEYDKFRRPITSKPIYACCSPE